MIRQIEIPARFVLLAEEWGFNVEVNPYDLPETKRPRRAMRGSLMTNREWQVHSFEMLANNIRYAIDSIDIFSRATVDGEPQDVQFRPVDRKNLVDFKEFADETAEQLRREYRTTF